MVTKAIVEDASNPCYVKVRIPTYDAIEDARGGTLNKDLSYATICALSNSGNNVQNGDVVFVSFEDDDLGKPVIIGHLVKEEKDESYSDASFRLLNTKSTTTLYKDTYIGDVTPQEIASLKGIKFNIQEQFNNINTNGTYIPQGGTLTAPLTVTGGDGNGAGKIILDQAHSGQITDSSTATLFGFMSPTTLTVGHNSYALNLRGSGTRPQYIGNDLALYSDIPVVNDGTLTIQKNGTTIGTFSANQSSDAIVNILGPTSISVSPANGYGTTVTSGSTTISNGTYIIYGRGNTGNGTWYTISVGGTELVAYQNVNMGYGSSHLWLSGIVTVTNAQTITHNLSSCWYKKITIS